MKLFYETLYFEIDKQLENTEYELVDISEYSNKKIYLYKIEMNEPIENKLNELFVLFEDNLKHLPRFVSKE